MYIFPYSEEEFIKKNLSGNYDEVSKIFQPGELVTYITKGPIFKPAKLRRLGQDKEAVIEFSEYKDGSTITISATVNINEIVEYQKAGPNIFIDNQTQIPDSIVNSSCDRELYFDLASEDLEPF